MTSIIEAIAREMISPDDAEDCPPRLIAQWADKNRDIFEEVIAAAERLGYRLVPEQPTLTMIGHGYSALGKPGECMPLEMYHAMLAAAPKLTE